MNKLKKTVFSIAALVAGFCFFLGFTVFCIYIEAKVGSKIFEMYFGPVSPKVAAGVVILSSFALQDVYLHLYDIKEITRKIYKSDSSDVFQKKAFAHSFRFLVLSKITNAIFLFIAWLYAQLLF